MTPPRRTPEGTSPQDATTASSPSMPRKAPGVKDVAALAGVSVGSVSNVINRRDSVRPDVRERVEAAIAQLGYKPNPTAQALRRGTSPLVGVAVFDLTNPFFMEAAAAMERVLSREGYIMTLSSTHASVQEERDLLEALGRQAVRGVLLTPQTPRTRPPRVWWRRGRRSSSSTRQTHPRACRPFPSTTARVRH